MPYGLYDGTPQSVPFLGGYLEGQQHDQQRLSTQIQQATGAAGLLEHIRNVQQDQQLWQALADSGGDLTKAMKAAIQAGNLAGAAKLAPLLKLQREQALTDGMLAGGAPGATGGANFNDPNFLRRFGVAMDKPAFLTQAQHLEEQQGAAAQLPMLRSQQVPITATPTVGIGATGAIADRAILPIAEPKPGAIPPEVQSAMDSGRPFAYDIGPSQNPAENTQRIGGNFAPLMQSEFPGIAARAKQLQSIVDSPNFRATPESLKMIQGEADRLTAQEVQLSQAKSLAGVRDTRAAAGQQIARDALTQRFEIANMNDLRQRAVAGIDKDGKALPMDERTLQMDAYRYLDDGTLPPNMGRGQQGAMKAQQIRDEAARLAQETGRDIATLRAHQISDRAAWAKEGALAGATDTSIRRINVAVNHLDTLSSLVDALDNGTLQPGNQIYNYFSEKLGHTAPTNFEAAKGLISNEIVAAVTASGGALADRERAAQTLSRAESTPQLKDAIKTYQALFGGQLKGIGQQRAAVLTDSGMGARLSERSKEVIPGAGGSNAGAPPPPAGFKPL